MSVDFGFTAQEKIIVRENLATALRVAIELFEQRYYKVARVDGCDFNIVFDYAAKWLQEGPTIRQRNLHSDIELKLKLKLKLNELKHLKLKLKLKLKLELNELKHLKLKLKLKLKLELNELKHLKLKLKLKLSELKQLKLIEFK
uniref:Uncharacterized protein n=1 Tax=Trichogramma kaykai TaxID=54128 RepID=A0ABD2WYW4_9HYME